MVNKKIKKAEAILSVKEHSIWKQLVIQFVTVMGVLIVTLGVTFISISMFVIAEYAGQELPEQIVIEKIVEKECPKAEVVDKKWEKCTFDLAYVAIKDGIYHDKGDVYSNSSIVYKYEGFACKDIEHNNCYPMETLLNSGFFKPYK